MTDQPERLSTDELPPGCPAWAGALFGELALESDLTSYRVVEILGLLEATRESLTGGAMSGGWDEIDGAPEWLSMVVQAHHDADSRFGAAHVVAEIEVVENILDDLRVELLRLPCGGAVEDVGRVEDVLGREVEPEVEPDGHDEDDVTPAAPAPKGGAEREAAMTHDAAGCALLACELCDAYGSGWADGLALAARDPWPAVVMGGTASYRNRDPARWLAGLGPVQVWSDGDRAGVEASGVLAKRVAALGGRASIERVGVGEDPGAPTLQGFVERNTEPDATVYTDDASAYRGMPRHHEAVKHSVSEYVRGMAHTNGMESHWAALKRGYDGVYHHMSEKHLDRYVTEFEGRHNQRPLDTTDQMAVMAKGADGKQLRYADLIA